MHIAQQSGDTKRKTKTVTNYLRFEKQVKDFSQTHNSSRMINNKQITLQISPSANTILSFFAIPMDL